MSVAFTIDLEPDWGVPGGLCRVLDSVLPVFLDWLEGQDIQATFFAVAEMTKRFPDAIRKIAGRHEVASHGLSHKRLDRMDRNAAAKEVRESKRIIEDVTGRPVIGFRAPFLVRHEALADDVQQAGYRYDASGGTCAPSPANWRLPKGTGPFAYPNGLAWLPISTMRDGLNPFSLTALRVGHPVSLADLPQAPRVFFLHLHELSDLPVPHAAGGRLRRALLRRGQGAAAWKALNRMVGRYQDRGVRWAACEDMFANTNQ
ncbi:MAG: polysaccharide deacetylase family protein [Planctomycetes bacterium]|nr:polysaccharide deacetylase family protein [Planctomycetota bacterium]